MNGCCVTCHRGREACEWCYKLPEADHEVICDCGLHDFNQHLVDCESRANFRFVIAMDYASAELPR